MKASFLILNILAIFAPIAIAYLFSNDRKNVPWKNIGIVSGIEILLGCFLIFSAPGRDFVQWCVNAFTKLIDVGYQGIGFALPDWVDTAHGGTAGSMNFVTSALLPILFIVPLFDILTYIGFMPWLIKWIGKGLTFVTGRPKFESFFSIEMMVLGNTEVIAISKDQIKKISPKRNVTIAMMSMSCVTFAIIGSYIQMMPGKYIIAAIPLNILSAIIITSVLNPVKVDKKDDYIVGSDDDPELKDKEVKPEKPPFFSYLSNSILTAGKLILIILASVIAFVALAGCIDKVLHLTSHIGIHWLSLENIFGVVLWPFAFLMGFSPHDAFYLAQQMGLKLVTNEFVVMGNVTGTVNQMAPHLQACLTVFLTSFANFSTVGMVIGAFKSIGDDDTNNLIAKQVPKIFLSGILVSLVSAAVAGLFVW